MATRPRARAPRPGMGGQIPDTKRLWMVIDPETREALRFGSGPTSSGPVFFTSEEALRAYCAEAGVEQYQLHAVPATVLTHMRGKPFWLDTQPCTVEQAARVLEGEPAGER